MSERTPNEIEASRLLPVEPESTGIRLAAIERVQVERDAARRELRRLRSGIIRRIADHDTRPERADDVAAASALRQLLYDVEDDAMPEPIGTELAGHAGWLAHGHQADWQAKHKGEPSDCAACKDLRPCAVVIVGEVGGRLVMAEYPKAPGAFVLPGGKVEPGEEPRAAAMREWAEETGYFAATIDPHPFFKGESHNGNPLWAYRANVWGSPADEWDGPEGRCMLVPIEQAAQGYHQPFVGAFGRVMAAYQEVGGEWGPGRVTGRGD